MDSYRIGHGYDLHRLQTGGRLIMGTICVEQGISAIAHSDGDVVIHALVDALLGAISAGDIGEHFPNSDPQWRGAASTVFLQKAMELAQRAGWRVGNVDVTILAERPKLSPFKSQMKNALAVALAVSADQVNIKAGTNEGCDAIGQGAAIACHAIVLLAHN